MLCTPQIQDVALQVLAQHPALYVDLENATLVRSMNGQESLSAVLEVRANDE